MLTCAILYQKATEIVEYKVAKNRMT